MNKKIYCQSYFIRVISEADAWLIRRTYTLWGHFKELRERILATAKSYSILKRSVATIQRT